MKTCYKAALASFVAVLALVSCQQKEAEPVEWRTELQVVSSDLVFTPGGGSGTAVLNLSGASVTSNASWCQASVSGEKINVTVGEWGGLESRYAVLTVSRNGESLDVSVVQYGVNLGGVDIPSELTFAGDGNTFTYECAANTQVEVSTSADWLTPTLSDGQLNLAVAANPVKSVRFGTLTISVGDVVKEVSVMQYPVFESAPGWSVSYGGTKMSGSTEYSVIVNTVSIDHGMYTVAAGTSAEVAATGLSEADYVRDVLAPALASDINDAVAYYASYGYNYPFYMFLLSESDWDYVTLLEDGKYIAYAIGFDADGYPTGWYKADEIEVGKLSPYQLWLGTWSVPRGDGADTWIVEQNVENESYKVSGIAGFDADDYATGAFVAIVDFDAETSQMVFRIYDNTGVTWQDSSRGAMNGLLSGQFVYNGSNYYTSNVGLVISRATMSEDGNTASLSRGGLTVSGQATEFHNMRWYGMYTNSSGSRAAVSWNGYETALPNTMTRL